MYALCKPLPNTRLKPIEQDLRVLCLGFYRPFVYEVVRQSRLAENTAPDRRPVPQWLNNEDVAFLFGNLETAYAIHAAFLTSLEWQFSQWPNPGWGGVATPAAPAQ